MYFLPLPLSRTLLSLVPLVASCSHCVSGERSGGGVFVSFSVFGGVRESNWFNEATGNAKGSSK